MMKYLILFSIVMFSIILVTNNDSVFATHMGSHHDDVGQHGMMSENMKGNHHISYKGMCAPGFASLDELCVLDDRCGPGIYAGKVCMMDGVMKQYLKPHHQKHAGISVDNIICAEGKQLMFKHHDSSPACVNSNSVEELKHRGWQTEKPVVACTMEYDPVCGMDGMTYGNTCGLNSQHMAMKHTGECMKSSSSTMNNQQFSDGQNENVHDIETNVNSQNIPVSIPRGSASPGCEKTNSCYLPYSVSVKEQSHVTWTNNDMAVHTATSGIPSEGPNGIFDSGLISPGSTFTNQFDEEGTFDYYCIAHPWMTGNVVVSE